jgi:hypothetical protein
MSFWPLPESPPSIVIPSDVRERFLNAARNDAAAIIFAGDQE